MKTSFLDKTSYFSNLAEAISSARKYAVIESYIWIDDKIGRMIAKAALNAADKGAQVIIRDDLSGSWFEYTPGRIPMLFDKTDIPKFSLKSIYSRKTGFFTLHNFIQISRAIYGFKKRPKLGINRTYSQLKNHKNIHILKGPFFNHGKTIIVDGKTAFVGGQCISKDYTEWKDYNVKIEGEDAVKGILEALLQNKDYIGEIKFMTNSFGSISLHEKQIEFIRSMEGDIYVQMAYLGERYISVFLDLLQKGNNVYFLASQEADTNHNRNMLFLNRIMKLAGYPKNLHIAVSECMIHTKGVASKNKITIGSNNFSVSSYDFDLNEHNLFAENTGLANEALIRFKDDFSKSRIIHSPKQLPKWSWLKAKKDQLGIFFFAVFTKLSCKRINAARQNANKISKEIIDKAA